MDPERITRLFGLHDRVAIVTGGTRGIGRAIAEGFVDAGAAVVVASRKADAVDETVAALGARGGAAHGVVAHMGDLDDLVRIVEQTVATFGRLDIVVNNAANALTLPIGRFTPEAWSKSFDVNLRGPVFLIQAALPHLVASGRGSVINILSAGGFMASPPTAMYSAAKAALLSFTRSMAADLATHHIRVNAIAPGPVDTDMVRNNPPEAQQRMAEACWMQRMADPAEMVGPALYLASDASSFMTGHVLHVDGGLVHAR